MPSLTDVASSFLLFAPVSTLQKKKKETDDAARALPAPDPAFALAPSPFPRSLRRRHRTPSTTNTPRTAEIAHSVQFNPPLAPTRPQQIEAEKEREEREKADMEAEEEELEELEEEEEEEYEARFRPESTSHPPLPCLAAGLLRQTQTVCVRAPVVFPHAPLAAARPGLRAALLRWRRRRGFASLAAPILSEHAMRVTSCQLPVR